MYLFPLLILLCILSLKYSPEFNYIRSPLSKSKNLRLMLGNPQTDTHIETAWISVSGIL